MSDLFALLCEWQRNLSTSRLGPQVNSSLCDRWPSSFWTAQKKHRIKSMCPSQLTTFTTHGVDAMEIVPAEPDGDTVIYRMTGRKGPPRATTTTTTCWIVPVKISAQRPPDPSAFTTREKRHILH